MRLCRAGWPFAGPPRAQPHKALALDSVIWFPILQQDTLVPDASVARRGTVVVLSLCEAAKREFGGFVQRVFRGFTSTIKLGVFEHPTKSTTMLYLPGREGAKMWSLTFNIEVEVSCRHV